MMMLGTIRGPGRISMFSWGLEMLQEKSNAHEPQKMGKPELQDRCHHVDAGTRESWHLYGEARGVGWKESYKKAPVLCCGGMLSACSIGRLEVGLMGWGTWNLRPLTFGAGIFNRALSGLGISSLDFAVEQMAWSRQLRMKDAKNSRIPQTVSGSVAWK